MLQIAGQAFTKVAALRCRPRSAETANPLGSVVNEEHSGISVITLAGAGDRGPDPRAFGMGIRSWLAAGAREVIVLAGPGAQRYHAVIEGLLDDRLNSGPDGARVRVLRGGADDRAALRSGWRAARGDYVALVAPGTRWAPDVAQRVAAAFRSDVGAVAVRQNSGAAATFAQRLGDVTEDLKTYGRTAASSRLDATVIGSWKGTAVFRRSVLFEVEETFLDEPVPAGDFAERLALLIASAGWETTFQRSARVWPILPVSLRQLISEAYAQGRDGWPGFRLGELANPASGGVRVARRRPYRSLCLVSWLLAGPATLVVLGYGAAAIWAGVVKTAIVLAAWSVLTHAIVMLPHLRRRPRSLVIVPAHLLVAGLLDLAGFTGLLIGGSRYLARRRAARPVAGTGSAATGSAVTPEPAIDPALRLKPLPIPKPRVVDLPVTEADVSDLTIIIDAPTSAGDQARSRSMNVHDREEMGEKSPQA